MTEYDKKTATDHLPYLSAKDQKDFVIEQMRAQNTELKMKLARLEKMTPEEFKELKTKQPALDRVVG